MLNILYTYKNNAEFEYLKNEYHTTVCNLNQLTQNFDYSNCDYIDITFIVQHAYKNPQNKVFLHNLEEYLNEYTQAIIHENQARLALKLFYTLFYDTKKLSDEIDNLKNLKETEQFDKPTLYYYNSQEYDFLSKFLTDNNIPIYSIEYAQYKEVIENFKLESKTIIDITSCFTDSNSITLDYLIKIVNNYNLTLICNHDKYNDKLQHYFKEKKHINEKYPNYEYSSANSKNTRVIDLDKNEFKNLTETIDTQLIGHEKFKQELYFRLKQFRELNNLGLKKIFSIFILGDSGLGKTEVARIFNSCLNKNTNLIKINFGNYSSQDSINSLIGSPRGYRGSEAGELSIKLSKPHSGIILCDEFEKADEKIVSFFLELLEEGKFTDSQSEEYDLNGFILIFTSNLDKNSYLNTIPNEFKSRIELTTIFKYLTYEEKEKFVSLEIEKIKEKIAGNEKYSSINLDEFNFSYDLNSKNNLRDIQRELFNQVIHYIDENKE